MCCKIFTLGTSYYSDVMYAALNSLSFPCSGRLWMQKLKSRLVRTQTLNVLLVTPGVGQHIAVHATLPATDFLPCLFLPFRSIHLHFVQNLSWFFLCWLWLTHGSCVGPQNKIDHPAGSRFPCWVSTEYKIGWKKKHTKKNMTCGMMTFEMNNMQIEWSLCSALM